MQQTTQIETSTFDTKIPEHIPASGEFLALLIPLAAPAIAYAVRAVVGAIARRQKARIENQTDNREYLQQQNELLLRELLDKNSEPKA